MGRMRQWTFDPGEMRDLGVSFDSELDATAVLTGATPVVSAWTRSGTTYTAATGFTFAQQQVNAAQQTTDDGEVIAIGRGAFFRLTAPATQGTYYIRTECDADDGTHPVRHDVLTVSGPGAPA